VLAATSGDLRVAKVFLASAVVLLLTGTFCAISLANRRRELTIFDQLVGLAATFALAPLMTAMPVYLLIDDLSLSDAYVEFVSCFTTTGGALTDIPATEGIVHFWRAEVAWLGGLLMWGAAVAIFRPLDLGGFESVQHGGFGPAAHLSSRRKHRARSYLNSTILKLAPLYMAVTAVLWGLLLLAGFEPFPAVVVAMSTVSTSGITVGDTALPASAGFWGEFWILLFMLLALSRIVATGSVRRLGSLSFVRDPEINLAAMLIAATLAAALLFEWHELVREYNNSGLRHVAFNCWGIIFTAVSYLTTTGFGSAHWPFATVSGQYGLPDMILMTLAMLGGGVATTAGGIKLLRIYLLFNRSRHEVHRIVMPQSSLSRGSYGKVLRTEGASLAWIFIVLLALSFAALFIYLSARGLEFEAAMTVTAAMLTTTGPLVGETLGSDFDLQDLDMVSRLILAFAMIVGRLELLVFVFIAGRLEWLK